jgi:transposase-like protein
MTEDTIEIPDDFDLATAKNQRSTTDDAERQRCPNCDSINVRSKSPSGRADYRQIEAAYLCVNCNTHFDD